MAKSLSDLIQLFEEAERQIPSVEISSTEDPLVIELREAEKLFDRRLEEEGDSQHIFLKVRIAEIKLKLARDGKVVLNEQHRGLSRRPQTAELEESFQGERYIIVDKNDETKNLLPGVNFPSHGEASKEAMKMGLQNFRTMEEPGSGTPLPSDKLNETEQQEWDLPFSVDYEEVRDRTGKKVCDCPTSEIAEWLAKTLNTSTRQQYKQQLKARGLVGLELSKYRNPEKSWFKKR